MMHWREEAGLRWRPLERFGVEIDQALSEPLSGAAADRFRGLFRDFGLIVARGQELAIDRQIALMALVGPVQRRVDGVGRISSEAGHAAARAELTFHADSAFGPCPLDALSLHAVDVVDGASSTRFANAERGCAALPDDLRARLATAQVDMISPPYDATSGRACDDRDPPAMLRGDRPAILVNPRTGRACLGVSEMHAARVIGMDWEASGALLHAVFDRLYAPENVVEHIWHRGDIVIWDNLTFQHARGSIAAAGRRILQRVTVGAKGLWDMYPELFPELEPVYAPAA